MRPPPASCLVMDEEHDTVAATPPTTDPVREGLDILAGAVERYRPVKVFALLCGPPHNRACVALRVMWRPSGRIGNDRWLTGGNAT